MPEMMSRSRKVRKSIFKRWWFWVLAVFAAIILITVLSDPPSSSPAPTTLSLDEMREQAIDLSYDDLARYPDKHKGKPVSLQGEVIQKISDTEFRVNVTQSEHGFWNDAVYFVLADDARGARLLEDDIVEFLGIAQGEVTYKAVLGQKVTVPRIDVYEVSVIK